MVERCLPFSNPGTKDALCVEENCFCSRKKIPRVPILCPSKGGGFLTRHCSPHFPEEALEFTCSLAQRLKPLYLELYQKCYERHPHPKIAEEIEFIKFELAKMLPVEDIKTSKRIALFSERKASKKRAMLTPFEGVARFSSSR